MVNREIEIGKSFFVLAQILGVIAGLLVVAGGFSLSSYKDTIETADSFFDLCQKYNKEINSSEKCGDDFKNVVNEVEKRNNQAFDFLLLGILTALYSIVVWYIGKRKIEKPEIKEDKILITSFALFAIYSTIVLSL